MPQLNPAPWFAILVFSWLILLTLVISKVLNFILPCDTLPQQTASMHKPTWTWQWS
uniref:ATP synthase complex subunit 8 n=1 Tax=Asterorhombus intermedius TaxID=1461741 RepID=A0A5B9XW66_9PLEU|nr:ATP synthase subunit 8 [Asterorhombus intermedius]QEH58976.1 ATP synthase subunit 8 [Asterorhombus intermedius]